MFVTTLFDTHVAVKFAMQYVETNPKSIDLYTFLPATLFRTVMCSCIRISTCSDIVGDAYRLFLFVFVSV